ncbi:MAG: tRNA lysidine(34) synthetase TilS [Acidimicrobiia bacterium]|nr:tRNA lysidine(34) synthetase TilS [Acidimicrobiia bacterium]
MDRASGPPNPRRDRRCRQVADQGRLRDLSESVLSRVQSPESAVLVALSGGADSAVCAWAMVQMGVTVRGTYVDHGWAHSSMMGEAAGKVAHHLDIDLERRSVDAPRDEGGARRLRYMALTGVARDEELIATGHTADDQVETVLAFILRGTGPEGLMGIPRERSGLVRPIIDVWRAETRELSAMLALPVADDPTNDEPGQRNDIRNILIPHLEETYNPAVKRALVRMSGLVAEEHSLIAEMADSVPVRVGEGMATIPLSSLRSVGRAVATEAIRRVCRRLNPPYGPDADGISRILDVVEGASAGAEVGGGLTVRTDRALLTISTRDGKH